MPYKEAFWEKVVESADSLIVVIDTRGKIKLFNRKAREITGYRGDEVLGRSWIEAFVPFKYRSRIQRNFDNLLNGKPVPQYTEYPNLRGFHFPPAISDSMP